jgi:hypothetical protein
VFTSESLLSEYTIMPEIQKFTSNWRLEVRSYGAHKAAKSDEVLTQEQII